MIADVNRQMREYVRRLELLHSLTNALECMQSPYLGEEDRLNLERLQFDLNQYLNDNPIAERSVK